MEIRTTATSFGYIRSVNLTTQNKQQAKDLSNKLDEDKYYVENKENSKKVFIMPRADYDYYCTLTNDITDITHPRTETDEDGITRTSCKKTYLQNAVNDRILQSIIKKEKESAINVTI